MAPRETILTFLPEILAQVLEQALNQARGARLGEYDDPVPLGDAYRVAAKSIQKKSRGVEVQRLAASSGTRKVQQVDDDAPETEADGPRPRGNEEGGRADSADRAIRRRPEPGARRGAAAGACLYPQQRFSLPIRKRAKETEARASPR